ncbi:MAG TPA: hypothetical protein DCY33_09975 [Gemmatimonadetes bacterium]|nr:hypothetical protein [Gemmatimonadota bacterium]HAY78165.1 hypothetical protein [Gemmatimonadota bacterium]
MSIRQNAVLEAIERWTTASIIDQETADRLRSAESKHDLAATARISQYVLATSGAAVLLIAGGVFLEWAWPALDDVGRTITLAGTGVAVTAGGITLEVRGRWAPSSFALQLAGVGLLLTAYVWSERAWADQSLQATIFGGSALVAPAALVWRSIKSRNALLPGIHFAAGLGFLAIFLDRSTPLSGDSIIWVLDGVLLLATMILGRLLSAGPEYGGKDWALNAFITSMGAGFVLVTLTATGPLGMEDPMLALDAWWALAVGLTVCGLAVETTPADRGGLQYLLALEVLGWIPLGMATARETLNQGPGLATLMVSGVAIAAYLYADRSGYTPVLAAAAIAFVLPIWAWAVEAGGATGGIAALTLTAGVLFWAAGRRGSAEAT